MAIGRPSGPVRSCIATRRRFPQEDLLRLALDDQGQVVVDLDHKQPGRGAWIQPQAELLAQFEARPSRLNRPLRHKGIVARGLVDQARAAVQLRVAGGIAECRRAGVLVSGRRAVAESSDLIGLIVAGEARLPSLPDEIPRLKLPITAEQLGRLIRRGPRALVGVRDSRPGHRLVHWLQWAASLG